MKLFQTFKQVKSENKITFAKSFMRKRTLINALSHQKICDTNNNSNTIFEIVRINEYISF